MARCFVIQPFDGGAFDKRYTDTFEPAIRAANLDPYRVDRDPSVSILIESIEKGIRDADVCLAEISTNNPNVWFELGFAIACGKEVVLVYAMPRPSAFPFDIQHRPVITYASESASDFARLGEEVTTRLEAAMKKERQIAQLTESPLVSTAGLQPHEIAALVTVMEGDLGETPTGWSIKQDMHKAGFTGAAAALAVRRLIRLKMISEVEVSGEEYNYAGYRIAPDGEEWLLANQESLSLRTRAWVSKQEDDLPF